MSGTPVLDSRQRADIMAELAAHAREYTPEWRYEGARDDPGSALAELFGDMFYQSVDRLNSVPEKLYTEFLNLTGYQMPDPAPASGLMRFTAHDTVEVPVPVPEGTEVFTRDEEGENVVYATQQRIESTPAQLRELFFVDPRTEVIERLDLSRSQLFFAPAGGENLQCHRFSLSQNEVLTLTGPFAVEVELRQESGFADSETAERLADPALGRWTFCSGEGKTAFTSVRAQGDQVVLTYDGTASIAPDENGERAIVYTALGRVEPLILDRAHLRSRPLDRVAVESAVQGDVPLDLETGDYCFGRRPAVYGLCYFRSDQVLGKRGARVNLRLEVVPVITEAPAADRQYQFNQRIIDKQSAAAVVPDDVYVGQVAWEYYNGTGWRPLKVSGDKNPFSCQREGRLEVVFDVPGDLAAAEVNAEEGRYIRARVVHVENQFSPNPRWVVPLLKSADFVWSYPEGIPADCCWSENDGGCRWLEDASKVARLGFTALSALEDHPAAMYFCFDRSPHAMPLSIYFDVAGRVKLEDKLRFEAWTGTRFEPVRSVDLTRNLLHPGTMLLYLPQPLSRRTLFDTSGYWLRLQRSSYLHGERGTPRVNSVRLNIVQAAARERAEDEVFSAGVYEANLRLQLFHSSVLDAQVWVDEVSSLGVSDAERLERELPGRVRLERDDRVLTHCWVLWERTPSLALRDGEDRCYEMDPYDGVLTFGDGVHGRVLPEGQDNVRVRYAFGGGSRGNRAAGTVTQSIGALPRISEVENLTPMSGGTDRLSPEKVDAIANKRLRNRGRAAGARDFEEIVTLNFPQVRHVKCFPGRDASGACAPGHVSVVVEGSDLDSSRVTDDLCQRVYEDLSGRCDCVMIAEDRLHVVGSTVITVSCTVKVEMEDLDKSAAAQQEIVRRLEELINVRWRERDIGSQIRVSQVWQTVRGTPNVRLIRSILLEGRYDQAGIERMVALEDDDAFPYATVKSGTHLVQIT